MCYHMVIVKLAMKTVVNKINTNEIIIIIDSIVKIYDVHLRTNLLTTTKLVQKALLNQYFATNCYRLVKNMNTK